MPGKVVFSNLKCGDNTAKPEWDDKRITITNNCADDAYLVLTPPTGEKPYKKYNLTLWQKTAKKAGMDLMYDNPDDHSSAQRYRRKLKSGESMYVPVPKGGIASGNFGVLLKCEKDATGTNWPKGCVIGGMPGYMSTGIGTLFEYSAGCAYTDPKDIQEKCTVNPSDSDFGCLNNQDFYDLSMVSGYSVPMRMKVTEKGHECTYEDVEAVTDLYDCPNESSKTLASGGKNVVPYSNPQLDNKGVNLKVSNDDKSTGKTRLAGCMSPGQWLEGSGKYANGTRFPENSVPAEATDDTTPLNALTITDWYVCAGKAGGDDKHPSSCFGPGCGGPQCAVGPDGTTADYTTSTLPNGKGKPYTNYVKYLKYIDAGGYAWEFNDDASTTRCDKPGTPIHVTLCPGPKGQKPYEQQAWTFNGKKCVPSANKNELGYFNTLLDCMKSNYYYTCQTEKVEK